MSTVTYTRRLNTGAYEHAEATWTLNPAEHGLTHETAAERVRELVHLTLGIPTTPAVTAPSTAPAAPLPPAPPALTVVPTAAPPASVNGSAAVSATTTATTPVGANPVPPTPPAPLPVVSALPAPAPVAAGLPMTKEELGAFARHHAERIAKLPGKAGRGGLEINQVIAKVGGIGASLAALLEAGEAKVREFVAGVEAIV